MVRCCDGIPHEYSIFNNCPSSFIFFYFLYVVWGFPSSSYEQMTKERKNLPQIWTPTDQKRQSSGIKRKYKEESYQRQIFTER